MTPTTNDPPSEREPLLQSSPFEASAQAPKSRPWWHIWPSVTTASPKYRFVPLIGCMIILLNESEYFIRQLATMRAIEAMHCIEYYEPRDPDIAALGKHIPEFLCKTNVIQKKLAQTAGLQSFVRMASAIAGAVPAGYLADKFGRKTVIVMHKVNVFCSCAAIFTIWLAYPILPLWTVYFTGLFALIGGNFDLGLAMLFASYTDIIPSAEERSALFFLTTSMQYVAQAICPPIGGWLMNLDGQGGTESVAVFTSLVLVIASVLISIFLFPETMSKEKGPSADRTKDTPSSSSISLQGDSKSLIRLQSLRLALSGVGLTNSILLTLAIFFATVSIKMIDWYGIIQYPVIKLGWSLSQSSTTISTQALLTLLTYSLLLPSTTRLLTHRLSFSPQSSSLTIMLLSTSLLLLGSILMGFSPTTPLFFVALLIYTLGEGFVVATQAYIAAALSDKSKMARVMALLSLAATGGKTLASALFPRILAGGLDSGVEVLKGLPFFVGAGMFLGAGGMVGVVGWRERGRMKEIEAEAEGEA